ncbi:hypothetical protein TNCV_4727881 [Trichonephila clavipes]|nr:hypothetical protein TNCV_4727881 [Trichonephila clavipes]
MRVYDRAREHFCASMWNWMDMAYPITESTRSVVTTITRSHTAGIVESRRCDYTNRSGFSSCDVPSLFSLIGRKGRQ